MMGDRDDNGERVSVKRIPGTARRQIEDSSQVFGFFICGQSIMALANGTLGCAFTGILQSANERGHRISMRAKWR